MDAPAAPAPSGSGLNAPHVSLIARFAVRFALRTGGGLVFLLVASVTALSVASIFTTPIEQVLERQDRDAAAHLPPGTHVPRRDVGKAADEILRSDEVQDATKWVTGADDDEVHYLLISNPALLSAIVIILLMVYPFLTCLGACNQTTGDIGSRGLRYLLLRTERPNIFLGRFVGTYLFIAANTVVVMGIVILYIGLKLRVYPGGELIAWGAQCTLALCILALPYTAMCAWVSGMLDSPFASSVLCTLFAGFPILFFKMLNVAAKDSVPWLQKLLPWGWKGHLISGDVGARLLGYGVMLAMTLFFLWIGLARFKRRDL